MVCTTDGEIRKHHVCLQGCLAQEDPPESGSRPSSRWTQMPVDLVWWTLLLGFLSLSAVSDPTTTLLSLRSASDQTRTEKPSRPHRTAALAMDFSDDVFGEEYDAHGHDGGAEAEADGGADSSGSSSQSSSSSSSAAASSSSSSGASSRTSSGGAGEDGADEGDGEEYDSSNLAGTRGTGAGGYRDDEKGEDEDEEVEEERDLFGSDNEDYVRTPARSNYLVPGPSHINTKPGANALEPVQDWTVVAYVVPLQN